MKVGLIGYGYWGGGFVARNIARVAELSVIVDSDPDSIKSAAGTWSRWGTKIATEPEVAFKECDAIWIATPVDTHGDVVMSALEHGCDVMCEKPFVLDTAAADEAVAEAEASGRVLMAGHVSLFTEQHRKARKMRPMGHEHPLEILIQRFTDRASTSDKSVLWGLGPHDVAALVDLFGFPVGAVWSGNSHRAVGDMFFDGSVKARVELDWLCCDRKRTFRMNDGSNLADCPDPQEPLFNEAQAFVTLCGLRDGEEMSRQRDLITKVTTVLSLADKDIRGE